jgi:hypothetical protein
VHADISADGNVIAFTTTADLLPVAEPQQVYARRRDGGLELTCSFVDVVRCERQITNGDERFSTRWEINRRIWRESDNHARVRFACRPGEEVTLRVVVVGKENRPIEATVTSRCVRGTGG